MRADVSIGLTGATDPDTIAALAPRIERLGFHALWLNDVPGGDSLAGLRIAADVTSTLRLATGVIPVDRRPADSLDLAGLPADRLVLGIGSGGARHPLGLVRDAVDVLRAGTDASIVVGALGPRMRRLAAERADGVLLNWLTPDAADESMRDLHRDAGGRAVRGILYARTIVDESAREHLEREAERYASFPNYAANFDRIGATAMDTTIASSADLAALGVVDELVLRAITPSNSLAELEHFVERAAEWLAPAVE